MTDLTRKVFDAISAKRAAAADKGAQAVKQQEEFCKKFRELIDAFVKLEQARVATRSGPFNWGYMKKHDDQKRLEYFQGVYFRFGAVTDERYRSRQEATLTLCRNGYRLDGPPVNHYYVDKELDARMRALGTRKFGYSEYYNEIEAGHEKEIIAVIIDYLAAVVDR